MTVLEWVRNKSERWAHDTDLWRERGKKMLAKLSVSHRQGQKVRYSFDWWMKKAQWQNQTGSFSNPHLQCPPATPPQSAVAGRLVWQAEREREREESKGYTKAAPWTVQTSLDQWPVQWLLFKSGASSVRARRKVGIASFHCWSSSQPAIDRR